MAACRMGAHLCLSQASPNGAVLNKLPYLVRLVGWVDRPPLSRTISERIKFARHLVLVICVVAGFGDTVRANQIQAHDSVAGMLAYCVKDASCNERIRDFLTGWIASGGAKPADADMQFSLHRLGAEIPVFCLPPESFTEMGMSHIKKLFAKWAEENPQNLHRTWDSGLIDALRLAFPCRH